MGGIGSGRHSYGGPATCERCPRLDMTWLRRRGFLIPGSHRSIAFSWHGCGHGGVTLDAGPGGVSIGGLYVPYSFTDTAFGGRRRWFTCPSCGQPCRVLFQRGDWRCRGCHRLQYASQYSSPFIRALDLTDRLRRRIGDRMGCEFEEGDEFPGKPPRMRWATYRALEAKYHGCV